MDPDSEKQLGKNPLLHQHQSQNQLQQQQLLKQQLQQQNNRQQSQKIQSKTEQQQHRLVQSQSQQQLSQIAPQFRQQQHQLQFSTKQHQPLRGNNQSTLQQQILQQEHLKRQKLLLDCQKKQEQALLELLQLQDTNDEENGTREDRLIVQQQRPQLIQQQQQLHLQQQQRQQQEHQQELHLLQQKQLQQPQPILQQTSQLLEQPQIVQQTQLVQKMLQQQSHENQPQFIQQSNLIKKPQILNKTQLVQQPQIAHQPLTAENSQTLHQSQVIQQPQIVQQPKIIQSQQRVSMSTQQTKKQPSHTQQLLQQQLQQLLSKTKNYPQRIVVLGSQAQQSQLVTQQPQRLLTANNSVQQQLLPQQMQCVVVTGAGQPQPQPQQMQRVVVASTGQQKQQPQQMQRVVVTSTSGQKSQQLTQQQLQQIQHVVIPGTNQQQSLQLQNVVNPCSVQQQSQQVQRVVVAATGQTQQQTQRVIVTSTSGQQQQQLVQSIQPVAQRIVIGQLKTSSQTQQIQSPSQRNVVLGHVQQQVMHRPSTIKQQQQRVVIAGQQQILRLPTQQHQQQSMQQLLKLPQSQQTTQQILKLSQPQQFLKLSQQQQQSSQEILLQQQLAQQLSQPKSQQNDIQEQYDGVQQQQHKQVIQQQANLKSSDQSLVQQLHVKQSHQQLQQLHIQSSHKQFKQQQKQLKQNQHEHKIEPPNRSGGVIIGQQPARLEADNLEQKQLQHLQRKNLQERLILQRQQQNKKLKQLKEQQLHQKQQLREQVLLQQHLKQKQHQIKQQASPENRITFVTGINQDQKQQNDQETRLKVKKRMRYVVKPANTRELVSLSSSSDEDDDDEIVREQRYLYRKTKHLVYEQYNAISVVLHPRSLVYYADLLKKLINGRLTQDELNHKFQKMIYVSTTSVKNGDGFFNDNTSVFPADNCHNTIIATTTNFSHDSLVSSVNKTITDIETDVPSLNNMAENVTCTSEETTITLPSVNNSMAHIASTLKKVEEKKKEIGFDDTLAKRMQLHNALVASLTAYMPLQILRQKRRDARARGFTETGFPLRLYTYVDVPQVRESHMHWYPHAPGSLARWYWPARIPCITSLLKNNIENQSLKSQQKEAINAVATAMLLRPISYESLPALLQAATSTEISSAAQQNKFQIINLLKLELNTIKSSRRKQFEQMAQKIRLRDWLTNWLHDLKVQGQKLEYREYLLTDKLRGLQVQIFKRRSKVLAKFKIEQEALRARVRRYCDLSLHLSNKIIDINKVDECFEKHRENNQNHSLIKHKDTALLQGKERGIIQQQPKKKFTDCLSKKNIQGQRRKSMFLMIKLLQDRYQFQSNHRMLQEIRQECLKIWKVYDQVRQIRKKYCPCCESDFRPCQYRKLMRKYRKRLRVRKSNVNESEKENIQRNNVTSTEKTEILEMKDLEALLVKKEKAEVEKKKVTITKITEPQEKKCDEIQQNTIYSTVHANVLSISKNASNDASTSTTMTSVMSGTKKDRITENIIDPSVTTFKTSIMTSVPRTLDIVEPVIEKHDVGVNCQLVCGETLQTQLGLLGDSNIQRQLRPSQEQCNMVNVADYAARAAKAALAASRRPDRRPSRSISRAEVNAPKQSNYSDSDDDDNDNRRACELMPPPPPLPPQPKAVAAPKKPTIGARYLQQQQLLLDRHKQLARMRQEEKEQQQIARYEQLRQQRDNGKKIVNSNIMMENENFSTNLLPPMQLIEPGWPGKLSTTLSQNIYLGSIDKDREDSRSKDEDVERPQQNNYYLYCGDYYSSDDELSGSSSIEPPFPPLLHDLRMDQLPRPSNRVPAAAVLPPGVRIRQPPNLQSGFSYRDNKSSSNDKLRLERQEALSMLEQRIIYSESKKIRDFNKPVQRELLDCDVLITKTSSPPLSPSPPLLKKNSDVLAYSSCRKLSTKMQSSLRKRLQIELLEKPGQRQQYQHYKNNGDSVNGNSQIKTTELYQQQIIQQEGPTNTKMTKSNLTPTCFSWSKVTGVEETSRECEGDLQMEFVGQLKNDIKNVTVPSVSKKKTKRQSKRNRRKVVRKRKDKNLVPKDEEFSSAEEEEKTEEIIDIDELRSVQWKAPLTQWNKRPISYMENINRNRPFKDNIKDIGLQIENDMECDVVSEEGTECSKYNQSPGNKITDHLWEVVSEIYLQDSEFSEMKQLDFEYRKLMEALLSDQRIQQIIQMKQLIFKNMTADFYFNDEKRSSRFLSSFCGNKEQNRVAIYQIHYWMSQIQQKREQMYHFIKRVKGENRTKISADKKLVVIQCIETVAEFDILQHWHDLLPSYRNDSNYHAAYFMYNDKRLFLIQDLIDQYYPSEDDKMTDGKWLRVATINLNYSEFAKIKRLVFEYQKLMGILRSDERIKQITEIQRQIVKYTTANTSDHQECPSHLILSSPDNEEKERKDIEEIHNLMSKIEQKWIEMYLLIKRVNNNSRAEGAAYKQLVITQRVESAEKADDLQLWHDFLLSAHEEQPNDNSDDVMDHFLLQELIDRYYPKEYDCGEKQIMILRRQGQTEELEEQEGEGKEELEGGEDDDERMVQIKILDGKREYLEYLKEQLEPLKNNKGQLKQLLKRQHNQYQSHSLNEIASHQQGYHDRFLLDKVRISPMQHFDDKLPLRDQLLRKTLKYKTDQLLFNAIHQRKICTSVTMPDIFDLSELIDSRASIFYLLKSKNRFRGSVHWWIHCGLERRISPLVMKGLLKIQTRPMVTRPFINQLQLTKPQTRTRVAQIVINKQKPIIPIMPTFDEEKKLWNLLLPSLFELMTDTEASWIERLQVKCHFLGIRLNLHFQKAIQNKQEQVVLLSSAVDIIVGCRQQKTNEERNQTHKPRKTSSLTPQVFIDENQSQRCLETSVVVADRESEVNKLWHELETSRKSHEKQWKVKISKFFEMKRTSRLFFREIFNRLVNQIALDNKQIRHPMLELAFKQLGGNFLPLNQAERHKLHQQMLNPFTMRNHYAHWRRLQNNCSPHKPKKRKLPLQKSAVEPNNSFKLVQLLKLVIDQEVPNIQELRTMRPEYIKQLLQKQSNELYQQDQNKLSLRHQIYKYMQQKSEQQMWIEKKRNINTKLNFRNLTLLQYNRRVMLKQQLERVNERLPKTCNNHQEQISQILTTSTQQISKTSVILVPQASNSKQQLSKSSVTLTPQKSSTSKRSSTLLIPQHYSSTSIQTSIIRVQHQPLQSKVQSNLPKLAPPTLKMFMETRDLMEQSLSLTNKLLIPRMELWDLLLNFPRRWFHHQLDDIVETRLKDLNVDIRQGLRSQCFSQLLQQIHFFDEGLIMMSGTSITKQQFERLQTMIDHLDWRFSRIHQLIGELTVLMCHKRHVISTFQSSWPTQQLNYSMIINLKNGITTKNSTYSMFLTFQQPLTFLQNLASPLLHLPIQSSTVEQKPSIHSLVLKLRKPVQKSIKHFTSTIFLQPYISNQMVSSDSKLFRSQQILKHQPFTSSVMFLPQKPSTLSYNLSSSQITQTAQWQQILNYSASSAIMSKPMISNSKILHNHENNNREKRRLNSGDESENCGKKLKCKSMRNYKTLSMATNHKNKRRRRSVTHQIKKLISAVVHNDESDDAVIISDSNDDLKTSDLGSELLLDADIQNPPIKTTVKMSDKSPLTIKLIKAKPMSQKYSKSKSAKDNMLTLINVNENQNYIDKEKNKVENVDKKVKIVNKINKKVKQKVSKEGLKKTDPSKDNEDNEMKTIGRVTPNKEILRVDNKSYELMEDPNIYSSPTQLSITVKRPTEMKAVVDDKPSKELTETKKKVKVALVESGSLMSLIDVNPIKVKPNGIEPVSMSCTIYEPNIGPEYLGQSTMGVAKSKLSGAEIDIKNSQRVVTHRPQIEICRIPSQTTTSMEKLKNNNSIEKPQINTETANTYNTKERLETNEKHQLVIPIHKTSIERNRHLVRTITLDFLKLSVPTFYDHGFAHGTSERVVHSRFVSTIMSMMEARSVALRTLYIPPQRLQLLMECATKKSCSNEPLTIGGVNINKHSTLSSLLDQIVSQGPMVESPLACSTSNLMFNDAKRVKKKVNTSTFQKPTSLTSLYFVKENTLITRPSRLTTIKRTPIVEEPVTKMVRRSISDTSNSTSITDVNRENRATTKRSASIAFTSPPSVNMTTKSILSQPAIELLERSNSALITTSNVTSSMDVTVTSSSSNSIKRFASAVPLVFSSAISNTTMMSPSLLANPPKRSKSEVTKTTTSVAAIATTESILTDPSNNLKRSRPGKRSTSVTIASSPSAVGPPKRSKSAVAMTVSPYSTITVSAKTTPIMSPSKTTETVTRKLNDTSEISPIVSPYDYGKGVLPISETINNCIPTDMEKRLIVTENMRTVTVKRNLCATVPAFMDVTTDACVLVVSACEQFIRDMVKERLLKGGCGAGTLELRRRDAFIAAMAIDDNIRPTPEYCRTMKPGASTIRPAMVDTHSNDDRQSVLEQQKLQNYITVSGKSKELEILTIETVVETQTTTTTTTSISSSIDKQFPTVTSPKIKTILSPLMIPSDSSARTRGRVVSKKLIQPPLATIDKTMKVQNTIQQPVITSFTRKRPLVVASSTSKEHVAVPSAPPNVMLLNISRSVAVPSTDKLTTAVSTSPIKKLQSTRPLFITTDTPINAQSTITTSTTVVVTKTPPISTLKKKVDLMVKKSSAEFSVQRGRPLVRPTFHKRQPYGSLVATCAMAAAELAVINEDTHKYSRDLGIKSDDEDEDEDEDIDGWSCYLGDHKWLPPVSRLVNLPICGYQIDVPVVSKKIFYPNSVVTHENNQYNTTKALKNVNHLLQQQWPSISSVEDNDKKNKRSQQQLITEKQKVLSEQQTLSMLHRVYERQKKVPNSMEVYREKFLQLQYGFTERSLLDQPELCRQGLVSWY